MSILSCIIYLYVCSQMTDVEAGGSTVFLDAETIIKPQKVITIKFLVCYLLSEGRLREVLHRQNDCVFVLAKISE